MKLTNQVRAGLDWTNRKFVLVDGVLERVLERVLEGIRVLERGYSDYRVLAQLGFGLALIDFYSIPMSWIS